MAYSSSAVANAIIAIAKESGRTVSNLVLQKIVFFAHGWYFGITNRPLVVDDVYAWQYGPVFPSLYFSLSKYGAGPVLAPVLSVDSVPKETEEYGFIKAVYEKYRDYDPRQLVAITHQPHAPWSETARNQVIPGEVIAKFYSDIVNKDE